MQITKTFKNGKKLKIDMTFPLYHSDKTRQNLLLECHSIDAYTQIEMTSYDLEMLKEYIVSIGI